MYRRLDQILEPIQKQRKRPALAQSRLPNTTQNIVRLDHHRDQSEPTYSCLAEVVRGIYIWMEMDTCFFRFGPSQCDSDHFSHFPRFGFSLRRAQAGQHITDLFQIIDSLPLQSQQLFQSEKPENDAEGESAIFTTVLVRLKSAQATCEIGLDKELRNAPYTASNAIGNLNLTNVDGARLRG